jgi:hypothetical protein
MGRDDDASTLLAPLVDERAPAEAAAQHASTQPASPQPVPVGNGDQRGSNTMVFVQGNEPVELEIQRLFGILRERLAEQAREAAASSAEQPGQTEPAPAGQEETATTRQEPATIQQEPAATPDKTSEAPEDADDVSTTLVTQTAIPSTVAVEEEKTLILEPAQPEKPPDTAEST